MKDRVAHSFVIVFGFQNLGKRISVAWFTYGIVQQQSIFT